MTVQQTTEYLKQAAALETSIYKQAAVKAQAKKDLVMPKVVRKSVPKPQMECQENRPWKPIFSSCINGLPLAALSSLAILIGVFGCFESEFENCTALLIGMGVAAVIWAIGLLMAYTKYKQECKNYEINLQRYERKQVASRSAYEQQMAEYNAAQEKAEKVYQATLRLAQRNFSVAEADVAKLDVPLIQTQRLLQRLYEQDVIFPKYRNMVAMCTMYEYFASGRCTELTGPTGAYNLYEAELRQNLIINQLEQVNANLEQVKQNQYILYQGVTETNQALRGISTDIKQILVNTTDIAQSSRIAAFCAQITAQNTEAMKWMAVFNS